MASVAIRIATAADQGRILDVITLAFAADPPSRWLYPDPQQYLANFPKFARGFGGRAFQHGSAYCTDDYLGAALWLPPDVHPDDEMLDAVLERSVGESQRKVVSEVFGQMASYLDERAALASGVCRRGPGAAAQRPRLGADAAWADAVRPRRRAGLSRIYEPEQSSLLRTTRVQPARHHSSRARAANISDVAPPAAPGVRPVTAELR